MTTAEVIQRVQSLYSKGVEADDTRLSERHIYNKLLTSRAKLIVQKANKRQKISQWNYQVLPCIEMIEAPKHECPCLPPIGCKILRSKEQLPQPMTGLGQHTIMNVTSIDGSVRYSEVGWEEYQYKAGSKYSTSKPDFFIRNRYLYLTYRTGPEVIAMEALFQNPEEVYNFPSFCDDPECTDCLDCTSPLDRPFPLDDSMIDTMIEMAANELIVLFSQNIEDRSNDSRDTEDQRSK